MATRTVFSDENGTDMDCYMNDHGKLYIGIGEYGEPGTWSSIALDKSDAKNLVEILQNVLKEMNEFEKSV